MRHRRLITWAWSGLVALMLAAPASAQPSSERKVVDILGPTAQRAVDTMIASSRGHVGIQMLNLTSGLREYFRVPEGVGVLVAETATDGPAASAGLRPGDVIVAIDGDTVRSSQQIAQAIAERSDGFVSMEYVREGSRKSADVKVEQRRSVVVKLSPSIIRQRVERSGGTTTDQTFKFATRTDGSGSSADLDLVLDELNVFFSGDGMRSKMERLKELDLKDMELRIRALEAELVALEDKLPGVGEPPRD